MEENDKRKICYRIITYGAILVGIDGSSLTNDDIILALKNLEKLSYDILLDLEHTLYTIYYEQSHKEE